MALRECGFETVMVNCNPETVSTDYDVPSRLYFEPLTLEDVMAIIRQEQPQGVILQFGGQTPLKLGLALAREGVPILGTSPDTIDRVEDRRRFNQLITELGLRQPEGGTARTLEEARDLVTRLGLPVLLRPSYVLGGRAMEVVRDDEALEQFFKRPSKPALKVPFSSIASSTTPSKSTSIVSPTAGAASLPASWSTSKRPASTRATRRAPCRPTA
jgi:carbamoyl-phosphate synthase large subunit